MSNQRYSRGSCSWAWQRTRWRFPAHTDRVHHKLASTLSFMYGGLVYAAVDMVIHNSLVYCYHIPCPAALAACYWHRRDPVNTGSVPLWWRDICRNS